MRVLLITPPGGFSAKAPMPPLGLLSLAAVLRAAGHEVAVRDYAGLRSRRGAFLRDLKAFRPHALGISILTEWRFAAADAARRAKKAIPRIRVIAGGPHPSGAPDDTARCPHFDLVVAGEAETVILQALRDPARIIHAPPVPNLDDLPQPAPLGGGEVLRRDAAVPAAQDAGLGGRGHHAHLLTSRGCPFDCAFCASAHTHGRTYRVHSIGRVTAEVEALRAAGARALWFCDDVLNMSPEHLAGLCDALRRLDPPMPFTASIRTDLATREQLAALRAAGCARLFFGVESANETALRDLCGKTCSVDQARAVARWCDELGIKKDPGYILGLPGETAADAWRTIDLMRELGGRPAVSFLRIYPGTRIERLARERGLIPPGASWWDARALRRLVCRPVFGDTPLYLDGLTWRDLGRLARAWAAIARQPLRRRGLRALLRCRGLSDTRHLLAMASSREPKASAPDTTPRQP